MGDDNLSMLRYYKRHVICLKKMLNALEPDASDLRPLATIQDYLIERIVDTERKIVERQDLRRSLKSALRQNSSTKAQAVEIKRSISSCDAAIAGYKYLLYVWRCFGDGVANKYVSKWNLKRLLYAHNSADTKQSSGYIRGKSGVDSERALMLEALSQSIPAILCDLTNIIRHGDVCLLGASDPLVIEVKSSVNRNRRTARQSQAIRTIHSYLKSDVGHVGGFSNVQRQVLPVLERHHNASINYVASEAANGRSSRASPEDGLFYIGFPTGKNIHFEPLFYGVDEPLLFMLNHQKTEKIWGNYYPFTLSLRDAQVLYAFLSGSIYLLVAISQASLKARATNAGFDLNVVMKENVGFELFNLESRRSDEIPFKCSEHFVCRLAFEFLSLDWFFECGRLIMDEIEEQVLRERQNAK